MQSVTTKLRRAPSDYENDENDDDAERRTTLRNDENYDEKDATIFIFNGEGLSEIMRMMMMLLNGEGPSGEEDNSPSYCRT